MKPILRRLYDIRQARSDRLVRLLAGIEPKRRLRRGESVALLRELAPHVRAARAADREQDRRLARRFNAFRYLRDDELGLSRIIADLLDPDGEHGQGTAFLGAMAELLGIAADSSGAGQASERGEGIRVQSERWTAGGRRIDLTVEMPTDEGPFCLAFENKPYATDQPGQCRDYLAFLDDAYDGRFLLVYLPARYRMPDESSLPLADLERWKGRFRVLPYWRSDGTTASLADWFGACRKRCEAERLRWFLGDAQLFCQHHVGESPMTDTEARYIRNYLRENPECLHSAFAVARAWPAVMHDVCRRFLEHLRDRIAERIREALPEMAGELDVGFQYGGDEKYSNYLRVYRYGWVRYETQEIKSAGRTAVMLLGDGGGPGDWGMGVRNPIPRDSMSEAEKRRRRDIEAALERQGLTVPRGGAWPLWPYWEWARHRDWTTRVPELAQELADGGGRITDHYVNRFLDIATKAIPAIDEVEAEHAKPQAPHDGVPESPESVASITLENDP